MFPKIKNEFLIWKITRNNNININNNTLFVLPVIIRLVKTPDLFFPSFYLPEKRNALISVDVVTE